MSRDRVPIYALDAYEYLRAAAMSDWAWEYLRRNPSYQSDAQLQQDGGVVRQRLANGVLFTRLDARQVRAEDWGLCCFR